MYINKKSFLIFILPFSLFSYDLSFHKTFEKNLIPDILSSNISITIESKDESDISNRLNIFNETISDIDNVKKSLGNLNIRPNYRYNSNSPKIIGYIGKLSYHVESKSTKNISDFINIITKLKENRDTSILINGLSWKVQTKTYNKNIDSLRLKSIKWIEKHSLFLSKQLHINCEVKKITINEPRPFSNYYRSNNSPIAMSLKSSSVPIPQVNEQKITLNTSFLLECT